MASAGLCLLLFQPIFMSQPFNLLGEPSSDYNDQHLRDSESFSTYHIIIFRISCINPAKYKHSELTYFCSFFISPTP